MQSSPWFITRTFSSPPQKPPHPSVVTSHSLFPGTLTTPRIRFLSLQMAYSIPFVPGCFSLAFIQAVACASISSLFTAEWHSIAFCLSILQLLDFGVVFYLLALVTNAASNIVYKIFVWTYVFNSLEYKTRSGIAGSMVTTDLTFWGTAKPTIWLWNEQAKGEGTENLNYICLDSERQHKEGPRGQILTVQQLQIIFPPPTSTHIYTIWFTLKFSQ